MVRLRKIFDLFIVYFKGFQVYFHWWKTATVVSIGHYHSFKINICSESIINLSIIFIKTILQNQSIKYILTLEIELGIIPVLHFLHIHSFSDFQHKMKKIGKNAWIIHTSNCGVGFATVSDSISEDQCILVLLIEHVFKDRLANIIKHTLLAASFAKYVIEPKFRLLLFFEVYLDSLVIWIHSVNWLRLFDRPYSQIDLQKLLFLILLLQSLLFASGQKKIRIGSANGIMDKLTRVAFP